jgi:glycosyltransferase involved in cell wall biosynthesis
MRILLGSHWFAPSIGGVEIISAVLADEFTKAGHQMTVLTSTPGSPMDTAYRIVRNPSRGEVLTLAKNSDVVLQNTISLQTLPSILASRKPIVVTHQSWMRRSDGTLGMENHLKRMATRLVRNVAISKAIAAELPVPSKVIGNPFDPSEFSPLSEDQRERDIVFMGRLVTDKGCDLLLDALSQLKQKGLTPTVTIIGDGDQRPVLEAMAASLDIASQLEFMGSVTKGRGALVAKHRIMVVPSRWAEPFGVVALEGIASGCALIASAQGGLPDAGGDCALYFENGDPAGLAQQLETLLTKPALRAQLVARGPEHLKNFLPEQVAHQYLKLFGELTAS